MVKDEQDSNNGVESEDSGFQLDADSSSIKIIAPAPVNDAPADMTVTTQKVRYFPSLLCDWRALL